MLKKYSLTLFATLVMSQTLLAADAGVKTNWGYKGNISPEYWGQLSPAFAVCGNGKEQSPINITKNTKSGNNPLNIKYQDAPMRIIEEGETDLLIGNKHAIIANGHSLQLNFNPDQTHETFSFNGTEYKLIQFHIHVPAENYDNGVEHPMEIHFVHQGDNGKAAAIGVWVKMGGANPTLQKMIDHFPEKDHVEVLVKGVKINPAGLLPQKHDYYSFMGSLTTPPCSEGLQWIMMAHPITASAAQIYMLKKEMGTNARPIQPLHGREVYYNKNG